MYQEENSFYNEKNFGYFNFREDSNEFSRKLDYDQSKDLIGERKDFIFDKGEDFSLNNKEDSFIQNLPIPEKIKKEKKFLTEKKELKRKGKVKDINRKKKSNNKKHSWDRNDNLKLLLRRHINTFLINLGNDAVNKIFRGKIYFRQIKSKIKKIKKKELKYKDIFALHISKKNKGLVTDESTNEQELKKIDNNHMELIEFFEQDLSDIIELYYKINKEICNNKIKFKTLEINLSDKTKTFHNLLEKDKYRIKKDKLLWIIDQDYI